MMKRRKRHPLPDPENLIDMKLRKRALILALFPSLHFAVLAEPAVDSGPSEQTYESARKLLKGDGVDKDEKKGFEQMEQAAREGYLPAMAGLGYLYSAGIGVSRNPEKAKEWFRKAAEQGHAISCLNLGKTLVAENRGADHGEGGDVAKLNEGVSWIRKAADLGLNDARTTYGLILLRGEHGVKGDPKAAAQYLIPASDGDAEAMNALATMYQTGNGVPYDAGAAERLWRKAAMSGHVKAQANLGEFLLGDAENNPQRREEALAWLTIAEQARDAVAQKVLQNHLQTITPDEMSAARKLMAKFRREIAAARKQADLEKAAK
jgi:TPR repeat protein